MVKLALCYTIFEETASILMDIKEQISKGVAILKRGGVVAFPTDTVYGLGASAYISSAVERIFRIKSRPENIALPLLVAGADQLEEVAVNIPSIAWELVRKFMPGALTLVLLKSDRVPDIVSAGGKTIGVRIPAHPVPIALIQGLGAPIVGTSANLSGKSSPLTAAGVISQIGSKVDLVIDGGRSPGGKESTVVDVTVDRPVILRLGAIPVEEIRKVCPEIMLREAN